MIRFHLPLLLGLALGMAGCGSTAGGVDLWDAVQSGDADAIHRFSSAGGNLDVRAWDGSTPLWNALSTKNRASYEALLKYGADPNVIMSGRRVVTHWAAIEQDPWWLGLALEHGADPNLINAGIGQPSESSPLRFAISSHKLENVKLLVEHGADINEPDQHNCYPISEAAGQNDFQIILYLLEHGADFRVAECNGIPFLERMRTCLAISEEYFSQETRRDLEVVRQWLKEKGVDLKADETTP